MDRGLRYPFAPRPCLPQDFFDPLLKLCGWTDVVSNPPFSLAEAFIRRAFELEARKVAILVRLDFLGAQKRHRLFTEFFRPAFVLVLSRRPSMPPGDSDIEAKGGMNDYCWIVWDAQRPDTPTEVRWLK